MGLHAPLDLLRLAMSRRNAAGCFSVYGLETVQAVLAAAETMRAPVMLSIGNEAASHAGLEALANAAMFAARTSSAPATVHLNHGRSLERIRLALDLGFPSLMFDGSAMPFELNCDLTYEAAHLAHRAGASIEGELGVLPHDASKNTGRELVERAVRFAEATRVDILALSMPRGGVRSYALLQDLCDSLPCPVAIHNGSRLGPEGPKALTAAGAGKINFHSEIKRSMMLGLEQHADSPLARLAAMREKVTATVLEKLALLEASGG